MQLMHFPRYIRRGARDYFYLALRPVLPGAPLGKASDEEGAWTTTGLPQGGFPYALATASLRPDPARPETKVRLLKIDPSVVFATTTSGSEETLAAIFPAEAAETSRRDHSQSAARDPAPHAVSLWLGARRAIVASTRPDPSASLVASGSAEPRGKVAAALAIDEDGMVLYAEVATAADPSQDGALLEGLLHAARAQAAVYLAAPLVAALSGTRDLAGHPVRVPDGALRLLRDRTPRARRVFTETPVLPPHEWMPLQRQTRLFKEPEPATSASADAPEP
jgi:hypothetical protein